MKARLWLDEDVIPELARVLRAHGYDALSVHEADALGLSDEEQLTRATTEAGALLSCKYAHFLRLGHDWFLAERPHAGIVNSYRQYARQDLRTLTRAALRLLEELNAEELRDTVRVLDEFRPR